jgi:phosphatidylethanolamine/phosphatidyl-N-methylethanolamine N-methyltransferase
MAVSFDRVASIYDATRWSGVPSEIMQKILDNMKKALKDCRTVLDIGTGTGRFAQYFIESGFAVVAVDVSLSMMTQAKDKGVRDLIRADAHNLPFRGQSFDGSIMIRVLHLVPDWVRVINEVGRVTRKVLISEAGDTEGFNPRQRYLELRKELGYPLNRLNDSEFGLRKFVKPKAILSAGDYWTTVNADEEIAAFVQRRSSVMWDVPHEVHERIIQRLNQENHGRTFRRHEIPEVVCWDPADLRAFKI